MDMIRNPWPEAWTILDVLLVQASHNPDKLAVTDGDVSLTYGELAGLAWGLAARLAPRRPRTVALLVPRSVAYLVAYFAGLGAGARLVPIDPRLTPPEIRRTLDLCQADVLLHTLQTAHLAREAAAAYTRMPTVEFDVQDLAPRRAAVVPWRPVDPDSTALLLHTSGSLSNPKRVRLSHRGLISNAVAHALHMGLTQRDRVLILLPMHFGYCNTAQILAHLLLGGTLVIMTGIFTPRRCLSLVQEYGITTFTAVPTMLLQLQAFARRQQYDTSSLRLVCFGGAPFPVERLQALMAEYPHVAFCQTYGQTEAGPRITGVKPSDVHRWPGSVGTLIPGVKAKLLAQDGQPAEPGEPGEMVVQGPGLMQGYLGNPAETAAVLRDGWLHTGDLARRGPDGEYYIVGRLKNFIIRGGINVYPEEIESVLLQHPAVEAVLVHGVPHEKLGEVPHACVVPGEDSVLTAKELRRFASDHLAPYKRPTIELVTELPRTYNGKVQRKPSRTEQEDIWP